MPDVVIHAEGLGKKYIIGHETQRESYTALRDVLVRGMQAFLRKAGDMIHGRPVIEGDELEEVWALRDVNFDVKRGEVVGIIGRNGAGKSTLLKILSRITEPTTGRVHIRGRVASLLEVGTGFHPELTGRENIFLNGAILGMTRAEIKQRFDDIVEFAEVAQFLDTPVKRYSSGMYVRLAFAVAAHLEPEILIVDEVLAVGDVQLQKKCLGKMEDVARTGRTVLFVSHNLAAIAHLCARGLVLGQGRLLFAGTSMEAVEQYTQATANREKPLDVLATSPEGEIQLTSVQFLDHQGRITDCALSGHELTFQLYIHARSRISNTVVSIGIDDTLGTRVSLLANVLATADITLDAPGTLVSCCVPDLPLTAGLYNLSIKISDPMGVRIWCPNALTLSVEAGDFYGSGKIIQASWMGTTLIHHTWASRSIDDRP